MRIQLVFYALTLILACIPAEYADAAGQTFAGKKIIFEEDILVWTSKKGTDDLLRRIKDAGFNVFSPNIWHGRGATWPSKYAEWDYWLNNQPKENFDPLKYLIDRAHSMGIEVHPWLNLTLREGEFLPQFAPPGTPDTAFDVHMPEFRHLMANLIAEVVSQYDVDGINLDYVRAVGLCASDFCKADYAARYNRDLLLDTVQFKLTRQVPTLLEYQGSDVTAMVQEISKRIRDLKPNIVISADVIPLIVGMDQGQNSIDWANKGMVDVLCRMAHYLDIDLGLTDKIRALLTNPEVLTIVISNVSMEERLPTQSYYSRDGRWVADTINTIQKRWPLTGVGVYMYKYLSDAQIAAVKAGPFNPSPPRAPSNLQTR